MSHLASEKKCSKCDAVVGIGVHCPRCGLNIEKFDPDNIGVGASQGVQSLWQSVEADWDNTAKHALFVETALTEEAGAFVARCYRGRLPDERARSQIDGLVKRLMSHLTTQQEERKARPATGRWIAVGIGVLLLSTLIVLLQFAR